MASRSSSEVLGESVSVNTNRDSEIDSKLGEDVPEDPSHSHSDSDSDSVSVTLIAGMSPEVREEQLDSINVDYTVPSRRRSSEIVVPSSDGGSSSSSDETDYSAATQPEPGQDPLYSSMMNSVAERIGMLSHTDNDRSICRVPKRLSEHNEDAYTPRIVSIGPIHFGQEKLQEMEVLKTRYMDSLFKRTKKDFNHMSTKFVKAILHMEERARSCYNELSNSNNINRKTLAEILLVDGCFLLELFLRWKFLEISGDPIFAAGTICSLHRDLTLLENQIPFFVLERLFEIILPGRQSPHPLSLTQLCASFFYIEWNLYQSNRGCKHLLDLIRNCHLPDQPQGIVISDIETYNPYYYYDNRVQSDDSDPRTEQKLKQSYELIHCVTKLRESGIKFVKGCSENLFDIEFQEGVLKIPKLRIDDTMDSLLRNMIAFEQCCHGTSYHFTSYAILMDCLIDSPADAEYLQHKRIIENYLGHGEEVSNIFNKISKKVFVEDFYFAALCKQVNVHYNKTWPKRRESFVRDYCFSPWKFIGVVAASILLLFAGLQTGYTMAAYHHPPK